jgi:Flp pilus assembly protein TadG
MRRLTGPVGRRLRRRADRLRDDRGAVAVLVVLLLVPLLGCGAIAVDVASLYADEQQLRNGADAAALAVATDCARGACGNTVQTAAGLTGANAALAGQTMGAPQVSVSGTTVTVTATATQHHFFAPALGRSSTTVTATSRAVWTAQDSGTARLPLAISRCEYDKQVRAQPLTKVAPTAVTLFSGGTAACSTASGGFGWLRTDTTSACAASSSVGDRVSENVTVVLFIFATTSVPTPCRSSSYLTGLIGTTVLLPVFDQTGGAGTSSYFRVYGYAAFRVTGYAGGTGFATQTSSQDVDPRLQGWFTGAIELSDATVPATSSANAPNLGAAVVRLVPDP